MLFCQLCEAQMRPTLLIVISFARWECYEKDKGESQTQQNPGRHQKPKANRKKGRLKLKRSHRTQIPFSHFVSDLPGDSGSQLPYQEFFPNYLAPYLIRISNFLDPGGFWVWVPLLSSLCVPTSTQRSLVAL